MADTAVAEIAPGARELLAKDDPELLKEYRRRKEQADSIRYPKPAIGDVENAVGALKTEWDTFVTLVEKFETVRYMRDEMAEKFKRLLEGDRRIRSRLTHNEILRVVAMLSRNGYKVESPAAGTTEDDQKDAAKRKRWGQEFFPAMERKAGRPLRRIMLDSAAGNGVGAWELYRTDGYKGLDAEMDMKDGEDADQYQARTDRAMMQAEFPYGLRVVTARALKYKPDEEGICRAAIIEWKEYRQVYADALERYGEDRVKEMRWPRPGDEGWQRDVSNVAGSGYTQTGGNGEPLVETWRYYDRCWYAYVVGGQFVDEPVRHLWGRVPVFPVEAIVTSATEIHERIQGITWGMTDIELALNDQLTYAHDVTITYGRPKPVVEIATGGSQQLDRQKNPVRINLASAGAPQLPVGARIVDAYKDFQPKLMELLTTTLINLWQRSGLNPIAQGASPGADPAGYTVNTLITSANDVYKIILDNDARVAGEVLDAVMQDIRENVGDKVFLPVAGTGDQRGTVQYLGLGPGDIAKAPMRVSIDPSSEQSRMARVQQLTGGWKDGVVPRQFLQTEAYGAEDPDEWDDLIAEEQVNQRLLPMLIDLAFKEVLASVSPEAFASMYGTAAPAQSGLVDQFGAPLASGGGGGPGAPGGGGQMVPPQPASVGADMAAASGGTPRANFSTVTAGQDRGYQPPTAASAPAG